MILGGIPPLAPQTPPRDALGGWGGGMSPIPQKIIGYVNSEVFNSEEFKNDINFF